MAQGALSCPKHESLPVPPAFARIAALLFLPLLAACAGAPTEPKAPPEVPGYEGVQDGEFFIQPVPEKYLFEGNRREEVSYTADDAPGTIVVDTFSRKLYFVMEGGRAMRYPIAVGREGLSFGSMKQITRESTESAS